MSGFKSELITRRDISKDFCWIFTEPLIYSITIDYMLAKRFPEFKEFIGYELIITGMPGFDFDYASIPFLLRGILPKNGKKYDRGAGLHDLLYAAKSFSKAFCDYLFLRAMLDDGVNEILAEVMYDAVDIFGRSAYEDSEDLAHYRNLIKVEFKNGNADY